MKYEIENDEGNMIELEFDHGAYTCEKQEGPGLNQNFWEFDVNYITITEFSEKTGEALMPRKMRDDELTEYIEQQLVSKMERYWQ